MKRILLTALAILCPVVAHAQLVGDTCVKIAETVAVRNSTHLSSKQLLAIRYATACMNHSDTSDQSLDVLYDAFSADGSSRKSMREASCSQDLSKLGIDDRDILSTKDVVRDGLDVVSQCLNLVAHSWDIKYKQYVNAVTMSIVFRGSGGGDIRGVDVIPSGSATCRDLPALPHHLYSEGVSFVCERVATSATEGGATHEENSTISVRLGDEILSVEMLSPTTVSLSKIQAELSSVNNRVDKLNDENSKLNERVANMKMLAQRSLNSLSELPRILDATRDAGNGSRTNTSSNQIGRCNYWGSVVMAHTDEMRPPLADAMGKIGALLQ